MLIASVQYVVCGTQGKEKRMIIRKAAIEDYDSIMRIMSQVQDMHVEWRPDVYKSNNEMISRESYKAALAGGTCSLFTACTGLMCSQEQ